ncbi:hypothetical protein [Novosphingobium huizhouense]|uniref:hypothetical protein n=1 Tax=Novosphingobium huizhouense TaxID=2866625 RepID=UPI001CD8FEB8|nr:hypothetical protein [Novosphingobium huizhouense]
MPQTAPLLGIEPKMYRHFAAITLVLSSAVAIFTNGAATPDAASAPPAPAGPAPEAAPGAAPRAAGVVTTSRNGTLIDARHGPPPGSATMDIGPDPVDTIDTSLTPVAPAAPAGQQIAIEIDPRELARMTPAQRDAALRQLAEERRRREAAGPYRPSPMELHALRAASAIRSGSDGAD